MNKRQSTVSIKWKILGYLGAFVAIMLLVLYLFQIVFMNSFYKSFKIQGVKRLGEEIVNLLNDEDAVAYLPNLARQEGFCYRVISEDREILLDGDGEPMCLIHRIPVSRLMEFFEEAKQNGGTALEVFEIDAKDYREQGGKFGQAFSPRTDTPESIIYVRLIQLQNGQKAMLLLNTVITPINTTVETIQAQLVFISILFLLFSCILGLLLSKKISHPIIETNQAAKELARQNYNIPFTGGGYLEIQELNNTLNYAAKELSTVDQLRKDLIANISHDLRTPLTLITGYGEMMRDLPDENTPENLQVIVDESKYLAELVSDILDLSQIQSGTQHMNMALINLTELVRVILLRYEKLKKQDGYQISFFADQDVFVMADEMKLTQVIYNLVNNAIHYTGADKVVRITQKVLEHAVRIEVGDTGAGIAPDQIPYIWERYYKVDKEHRLSMVGTGLGLSIVKAVLQAHRAEYGVESTLGKGSVFWFELSRDDRVLLEDVIR